jgi:hypothetical protein
MADDLRARLEAAEGTMQKLAEHIPGFSGYRERGLRRKADELVRLHLVGLLDDTLGKLDGVISRRADSRRLDLLDDLDRLRGRVRKVRDGLRYADYGYTGWWDAVKIREAELDRMYQYDLDLRTGVVALDEAVQALAAAAEADLGAQMQAVDAQAETLQQALDHRGEAITALVP